MCLEAEDAARACLAHLEREKGVLGDNLATLQQVRKALLQSDLAALTSLQDAQERAAEAATRLRTERERLRQHMASSLNISPSALTLRRLADSLSHDLRQSLHDAGDTVRRLAVQVDELNRGNAALVGHYLSFTQRLLLNVTGGERPAVRYGPRGMHLEASGGSLLRTRG